MGYRSPALHLLVMRQPGCKPGRQAQPKRVNWMQSLGPSDWQSEVLEIQRGGYPRSRRGEMPAALLETGANSGGKERLGLCFGSAIQATIAIRLSLLPP